MVCVHQGKQSVRKEEWIPRMSATWVQLEGIVKSTRYRKTNNHMLVPIHRGQDTGLEEQKSRRMLAVAGGREVGHGGG